MQRAGRWENGGSPRFLLRVDDFPRWDRGPEGFRVFHAILKDAGVRYLLGVIPRPAEDPQDAGGKGGRSWSAEEAAMLAEVAPDVEMALHGWTHRRRPESVPAEIVGCPADELEHGLHEGLAVLRAAGLTTHAYIPPFNAVDREALTILARKFDLVCGGPESVRWLGCLPGPCRLAGVWFLPSYPPAYGRAAEVAEFVRAVRFRAVPILIPLTLHWSWEEADKFDGVRRLADALAGATVSFSIWVQGRAWMP
jgi:peptidoglycan/xylan/chitin deacetylase (PgdA/CDA1 family)